MPTDVAGSRLPVGSSASRISGRLTNARAIDTRCCSPPESSSGRLSALSARPTSSRMAGTWVWIDVPGPADHLEGEGDVLVDGLVRQQLEVLEDAPDVAAQVRDLPARQLADVLAGHADPALARASPPC